MREPGWLPFTTADVREQNDADADADWITIIGLLCDAIDELREAVAR